MRRKSNVNNTLGSVDLFGNITPLKSWDQKYQEYIRSPEWKKKCKEALARADYKCQKCQHTKWSRKLNVHHKTYEHLTYEPPEDLIVVCIYCHKIEDWLRDERTAKLNYEKLQDARFEGWAIAVYGDNWMLYYNEDYIYYEFQDWLARNDY